MPGFTATASAPAARVSLITGRMRFVHATPVQRKPIEKPPQHGEKPFEELVRDSFDGAMLRLSQRMKLLEEADSRGIRRGTALDLIATTQKVMEKKHRARRWSPIELFATRYAAFATAYVAFALAWCVVVGMQ